MKTKLLILLIVAVIMGCEKDKEEGPAYVGTWEYNEEDEVLSTDPVQVTLSSKMVLTLTKDSWQMISRIKVTPFWSEFEDFMGFKGTMTVDGEDVEIVFKEVGYREVNEETYSFIDDEITWYSESEDPNMFGMLFDDIGPGETTISGKMIVEGGKLTMKMDENKNNQYEPDEITVFTKAK
jgi:hypothetical protein